MHVDTLLKTNKGKASWRRRIQIENIFPQWGKCEKKSFKRWQFFRSIVCEIHFNVLSLFLLLSSPLYNFTLGSYHKPSGISSIGQSEKKFLSCHPRRESKRDVFTSEISITTTFSLRRCETGTKILHVCYIRTYLLPRMKEIGRQMGRKIPALIYL